uniref:ribosomal protein L6 n=1 Tax=Tsunamia transpacifica TaxID=1935457 RepID=UPI001BF12B36|nr:ribosomal protein L6 [Tsunamia transpacifica]QUE27864.1 ribosomal protein L6 [Tsunamia transpacifica]UNJ14380.1 ribosomal protein L6 [Tsunamia transpacifica]
MSRIGKQIIKVPPKVEIKINNQVITAKGPKGELSHELPEEIYVSMKDQELTVQKSVDSRKAQQLYGLNRTLVNNIVIGVSEGFNQKLEIHGVGYRSQMEGKNLILNLGYSHSITITPPENIVISVEKNTMINIFGINKELVGQIAANIRSTRSPEPYKGKGVRYENEVIKLKVGKAGKGK